MPSREVSLRPVVTESEPEPEPVPESAVPAWLIGIRERFSERGYESTVTGLGDQEWLIEDVPSATLIANGRGLTVWLFPGESEAASAAANITSDGVILKQMGTSSMGTKEGMRYPAPAYYYRSERLLLLYFALEADRAAGADKDALTMLEDVVGPAFAVAKP